METKIICDTGIISDFFEGKTKIVQKISEIGANNIVITPVIRIELIRWLSLYKVDKSKRTKILKIIKKLPLLHINEGISKIAVDISDKDNTLDAPDILIGATAIYHKIPVYTLNEKHFERISDIKLYK